MGNPVLNFEPISMLRMQRRATAPVNSAYARVPQGARELHAKLGSLTRTGASPRRPRAPCTKSMGKTDPMGNPVEKIGNFAKTGCRRPKSELHRTAEIRLRHC